MGLGLEQVDPFHKKNQTAEQKKKTSETEEKSESGKNAELYSYYEELIKEHTKRFPNANDKLALALILSRGARPTVSKNRELTILDIDKTISMQHRSLK